MRASGICGFFAWCGATLLATAGARGEVAPQLAAHLAVVGTDVASVEVADARKVFEPVAWDDLSKTPRAPGTYTMEAP